MIAGMGNYIFRQFLYRIESDGLNSSGGCGIMKYITAEGGILGYEQY